MTGGKVARDGIIQWATASMPSALASTVRSALQGIATTGECRHDDADWIVFGEVVDSHAGPPLQVNLKRTSCS